MIAATVLLSLAANAQTRVWTIEGDDDYERIMGNYFIPGDLTSSGITLMVDDDGKFYDNNLTVLREIAWGRGQISLNLMDLDGGTNYFDYEIPYTQTLFNNDAEFEYLRGVLNENDADTDSWGILWYTIKTIEVVSAGGNVLFTIQAPEGKNFGHYPDYEDELYLMEHGLFKWGGEYYLGLGCTSDGDDPNRDRSVIFYHIDRPTQSITRVDATLPMNVFPTVANRDQTITVVLGEGTVATEVQVVDAIGRVVKSVAVQPGEHEVQLRASDLRSGMHIVGARNGKGQAASKIIIR